jgi:hypothetical protein
MTKLRTSKKMGWNAICILAFGLTFGLVASSSCNPDDNHGLKPTKEWYTPLQAKSARMAASLDLRATDIGCGGGLTFAIAREEITLGGCSYSQRARDKWGRCIYKWDGKEWSRIPGLAVSISVDPRGDPWVVNSEGKIFKWEDGVWLDRTRGRPAQNIGIGAEYSVYITAKHKTRSKSGHVFKWAGNYWERVPGDCAKRIAVNSAGRPWIVNTEGDIFEHNRGAWVRRTCGHLAQDIGFGKSNLAFIATLNEPSPSGGRVYRWGTPTSGYATRISVNQHGFPWTVNRQGEIFEATNPYGGWVRR